MEVIKSLGNKIKEKRKQLGLTQEQLAKLMGYTSTSTIAKIENGINDVPINKLQDFARVLNTTPEYLMNWNVPKSNIRPLDNKIINIPVYESISAGYGAIIDNTYMDINELEFIPIPEFPNSQYCFGVKVSGDSMEPLIPNGSIVIINTESAIDNNNIGAFLIDNEAFLKRKKIINNNIILISVNEKYDPIIIDSIKNYREIGKVIKIVIDM